MSQSRNFDRAAANMVGLEDHDNIKEVAVDFLHHSPGDVRCYVDVTTRVEVNVDEMIALAIKHGTFNVSINPA